MIVGVAYLIDYLCYKKEQDLTLQLASSSMVYAEQLIQNHGEVFRKGKELFAGDVLLNNDTTIVDLVMKKTGFGCTIFLDSTRISTTAIEHGNTSRAIGTHANAQIIESVFKNGNTFRGITSTIGKKWVILYIPLKTPQQKTVGMLATYIDLEEFTDSRFHFRLFSSLIFIFLVLLVLGYSFWNRYLNRDIEVRALKEIKLRNDELEGVNKALDSFVYRVSHDLKAPIINMQSMLIMLPSVVQLEKESTAEKIVANLNLSAQNLEIIISDLLEISRIDRRPAEKEIEIDMKVLLDDLIWNMDALIKENNGEIEHDLVECPKITAPPIVIRGILTNLINNAFKYKSPNRTPRVTVRTFIKNEKQCISISDNGIGIDLDKYRKKLFKMFSRLHPYLDVEGSGVGLHIVKKMLDSIEAKIELESSINKGTTFLITFKN